MSQPVSHEPVVASGQGAPANTDFAAVASFQRETGELRRLVAGAGEEIGQAQEQLRFMRAALMETPGAGPDLFVRMDALGTALQQIRTRLSGDPARQQLNQSTAPSISGRVGRVVQGHWDTRQNPTVTQRRSLDIARAEFGDVRQELSAIIETDLAQLEADLEAAGAPWTPGRR